MTAIYGAPGLYVGRGVFPANIFKNWQTARFAPSFYFIDGQNTRDATNNPSSMIRAGMLLGKITSAVGDVSSILGNYGASIIGPITAPLGGGQTTLTVAAATAVEIVRRFGATGTFNLTGEPFAGAPARSEVITYSAVNQTTGAITITASDVPPVAAADQVNSLVIVDNTGSGNFTITVGGITTPAIAYSATAATLVSNINAQANIAFGTDQVIAAGGSLAAITLTMRGTYANAVVLPVYLTGSTLTGTTVNGQVFSGSAATQVAPVGTVGNPAAVTAPVYAVNTIPFVDVSSGTGTFNLTIEGVTTGAITYSATVGTLASNINAALQTTFGPAFVCSGASLAALILTAAGSAYAPRPLGAITATVLAGASGFSINGVSTVGTPSVCAVSVAGVSLVTWAGATGNFVTGSIVQPQDGSQNCNTIFCTMYGAQDVDTLGANIQQPIHKFVIGGDAIASALIMFSTTSSTPVSAGVEAFLKAQLRTTDGPWTFDDDR